MPMGIPPNLASILSSYQSTASQAIKDGLEILCIPARDEYTSTFLAAYHDVSAATKSTYQLAFLTFRPLCILGGIFLHYVWIVLKILGQHTVHHGYVACCEGYVQLKFAARWFVSFQKSLSRGAIAVECGVVAALVGLYLLRRYIQKKQYVDRFRRWYGKKKRASLQKYNGFVHKISQTSLFLAMILPHLLYVALVSAFQYIASPVCVYFATKTYLTTAISLWHPLVKTILLLHRWAIFAAKRAVRVKQRDAIMDEAAGRRMAGHKSRSVPFLFSSTSSPSSNQSQKSSDEKNDIKGPIGASKISGPTHRQPYSKPAQLPAATITSATAKSKSKLGQRWLRAAEKSSIKYPSNKSANPSTNSNDDATNKAHPEDTLEILAKESLDLLQYWIVYGLLCALFSSLSLLPIVGTLVTPVGKSGVASDASASSSAKMASRWGARRSKAAAERFSTFRVTSRFSEQVKMFFFIWLTLLPTSLTVGIRGGGPVGASTRGGGALVKSKKLAWEKKMREDNRESRSNRPMDIIYRKIVPVASGAVTSSVHLLRRSSSITSKEDENEGSMLRSLVGKLGSFLDLAVLVRLISKQTKENIISVLVESTSLVPAAATLVMPGYFTHFGCIYVSGVAPAAHSSKSYTTLVKTTSEIQEGDNKHDDDVLNSDVETVMRYLQYWVLYVLLSGLLASFEPLLAWVPLSYHMTWLLWAYVSWESTTKMLYNVLEMELVAFGILHYEHNQEGEDSDEKKNEALDIDKTLTVRLIRGLVNRLPSSISLDTKGENQKHSAEEGQNNNASTSSSAMTPSHEENDESTSVAKTDGADKSVSFAVKGDNEQKKEASPATEIIAGTPSLSTRREGADKSVSFAEKPDNEQKEESSPATEMNSNLEETQASLNDTDDKKSDEKSK